MYLGSSLLWCYCTNWLVSLTLGLRRWKMREWFRLRSTLLPSGRAIHVPQISTQIYGGIPGDHPWGNFLIISLRKFGGNEGEFSTWIFPSYMKISQWRFDVILWWIKMFTGLGKLPSHFNLDLNISPELPRGLSFHLQPKFPSGFPPPTTTIPGDSPQNPRDFTRLVLTDTS